MKHLHRALVLLLALSATVAESKMLLGKAVFENSCAARIMNACAETPGLCANLPGGAATVLLDHGWSVINPKNSAGVTRQYSAGIAVTPVSDGFLVTLDRFRSDDGKGITPIWRPSAYFCNYKPNLKMPVLLEVIVQTGLGVAPDERLLFPLYFDPRSTTQWSVNEGLLDETALAAKKARVFCVNASSENVAQVHALYEQQRARVRTSIPGKRISTCGFMNEPMLSCQQDFEALGDKAEAEHYLAIRRQAGCMKSTDDPASVRHRSPTTKTALK